MTRRFVVTMIGIAMLASVGWATAADKPADAIESASSEWSGIQTDLLEVKRMPDNTLRVRWRWRNTSDQEVKLMTPGQMSGAIRKDIYLLDGVNRMKHPVVRDSKGQYIATQAKAVTLKPNESAEFGRNSHPRLPR